MAESSPIEKLRELESVNIQNAGMILLAAVLTPIVTFFERTAAFVASVINFPIGLIDTTGEQVGEFIVALIGGAAGVIDAAFFAGERGFSEGVWGTLGPFAPTIGVGSILLVTFTLALYFREESTADSIFGIFTATDIPLLGADEED